MNINDLLGPIEKKKKYRTLKRLVNKTDILGNSDIDYLRFLPQLSWWKDFNSNQQELIFRWLARDPDVPYIEDVTSGGIRGIFYQLSEIYSDVIPMNVWENGEAESWINNQIWGDLADIFEEEKLNEN